MTEDVNAGNIGAPGDCRGNLLDTITVGVKDDNFALLMSV